MAREVEPWTLDEIARLAQALDDDLNDGEIASALDRTERAVAQKRRAMGWLRKAATGVRPKVQIKGIERRYRTLLEYMQVLVSLARSQGAHDLAEIATEALVKAAATDVHSPDAFPPGSLARRFGVTG